MLDDVLGELLGEDDGCRGGDGAGPVEVHVGEGVGDLLEDLDVEGGGVAEDAAVGGLDAALADRLRDEVEVAALVAEARVADDVITVNPADPTLSKKNSML